MLGYLEEIAYRDKCYMNKQVLRILEIYIAYLQNDFSFKPDYFLFGVISGDNYPHLENN